MAPTPPIVPSTATLAPAPSTPPTAAVDEHRLWLDGLSLHDRLRYDRTFGHAWFAGNSKEQCSAIARKAVEGSRHVGAGSNLSLEAEQVCDRAPGALASSRPSALSPVPALFASSACQNTSASSAVPASFACLGVPALAPVPALSACPDTSASSLVPALSPVPASLPVPALLACPNTSASLASLHVPASLERPGVPASLNVPASSPVPALSACPHAPASSHHVGAGSNISGEAEQVRDRAPGRNGRQHGQDGHDLAASVNGSFAGTYAEDRDGNSRASSFCLFLT